MTQRFPIKLFEGQANFIKTLRFHPCAEPFPILVETFFPCVLMLAIDLYLFDEQDVAMDVLKDYPRYGKGKAASRGYRHNTKRTTADGPRSRKRIKAVPFLHKPVVKGLTTFLYNVAAPLEKVGFVFMFYSAVDNFFMNWSSLLIRRGYCELPALTGPITLKATPSVQVFTPSGSPCGHGTTVQNRGGWTHSAFAVNLPPGTYTAIWSMTVRNPTDTPKQPVKLTLKEGAMPVAVHSYSGPSEVIGGNTTQTIMASATFGSPTFILNQMWWECETDGSPLVQLDLLESTITIWQEYTEISY